MTSPEELAAVIAGQGFEVERVENPPAEQGEGRGPALAPIPESAPAFFAEALRRARAHGEPAILDFGASWCAPCVRLEEETLADEDVVRALEGVNVVRVDVDEHPALAQAYGVRSVPDVVFVNRQGLIVDRLHAFEPPAEFLTRLDALWDVAFASGGPDLGDPAPLPGDAPATFREAFQRARRSDRPIVIDFWAEWCAPCVRLRAETLEHADVAAALEAVELIRVDLDQQPELAADYGVETVPDVLFIDRGGFVVDRLRGFEPADRFLARLRRLLDADGSLWAGSLGVETGVPSEERVEALALPHRVRQQGRAIVSLDPDGPAARAGLSEGDVLLRAGGVELYSQDDLSDVARAGNPGDRLRLLVVRSGRTETEELDVELGRGDLRRPDELQWPYASLAQLPRALEEARAAKKKVMVGLSGSET